MAKVKQLTIACENRPGSLAELAEILGKAKVNILAFNASSAGAMGYVQLIVDNANRAKKAFRSEEISYYEELVLHVSLPNVPGALAHFAHRLAAKNINIGAGYQTTAGGMKKASVVLAVSNIQTAGRIG